MFLRNNHNYIFFIFFNQTPNQLYVFVSFLLYGAEPFVGDILASPFTSGNVEV